VDNTLRRGDFLLTDNERAFKTEKVRQAENTRGTLFFYDLHLNFRSRSRLLRRSIWTLIRSERQLFSCKL
jgi:hypothetical protein